MARIVFQACSDITLVGSPYKQKSRAHYSYALNETASLVDPVMKDHHDPLPKSRYKTLDSVDKAVKAYQDTIDQHLERRVMAFFQQAIGCYRTDLYFTSKEAPCQGSSPTRIVIGTETHQRNAAHSSTLPGLIAHEKKDAPGYLFLEGTDSFRTANATINMPRFVNNADIQLDGRPQDNKLRAKALVLLNKVSKGTKRPDEAVRDFIDLALNQVKSALKGSLKPAEEKVLKLYQKTFIAIQELFQKKGDQLFQQLLGIQSLDKGLKTTFYDLRFRAIRDSQLAQAAIMVLVNQVKESLKKRPAHFETAFRLAIIATATNKADRQALEQLFNLSAHYSPSSAAQKTKLKQAEKVLEADDKKIKALAKEILSSLHAVKPPQEAVIQELRQAKKLSIKELSLELKITAKELGDLEAGKKELSSALIRKISAFFACDRAFFSPV